jgi:hypothetical protein
MNYIYFFIFLKIYECWYALWEIPVVLTKEWVRNMIAAPPVISAETAGTFACEREGNE